MGELERWRGAEVVGGAEGRGSSRRSRAQPLDRYTHAASAKTWQQRVAKLLSSHTLRVKHNLRRCMPAENGGEAAL